MGAFRKGIVIGFAAGYIKGAKAGRERYEQIMRNWEKFKTTPLYQQAARKVDAAVGLGIERGKLMVLDSVHRATGKMRDASHDGHEKEVRSTFH